MTIRCTADGRGSPIRATELVHNTMALWAALKNRASPDEGAEIAGILQVISAHSLIMHQLIYDIACRDVNFDAATHRKEAQLHARQQLESRRGTSVEPHIGLGDLPHLSQELRVWV